MMMGGTPAAVVEFDALNEGADIDDAATVNDYSDPTYHPRGNRRRASSAKRRRTSTTVPE